MLSFLFTEFYLENPIFFSKLLIYLIDLLFITQYSIKLFSVDLRKYFKVL